MYNFIAMCQFLKARNQKWADWTKRVRRRELRYWLADYYDMPIFK